LQVAKQKRYRLQASGFRLTDEHGILHEVFVVFSLRLEA
jgi:hypothetical protein